MILDEKKEGWHYLAVKKTIRIITWNKLNGDFYNLIFPSIKFK